jgi:4-carboxymuconolactone decarboxylase
MRDARIRPLPMSEMSEEAKTILGEIPGSGLKGDYFPRNVIGTLMHNGQTFTPFIRYWVTSKLKMGLTVREQEIVILRMGMLYRSEYVWKHHVPVGSEFGITEEELAELRQPGEPKGFNVRERALVALTDELVERRDVGDEAWSRWGRELTGEEMIDLIALVSQYVLFALTNNVMRVELEGALQELPGL